MTGSPVTSAAVTTIANTAGTVPALSDWLIYAVIAVVLLGIVIALAKVLSNLGSSTSWSLCDALSEEADVTVMGAGNMPYMVNNAVVKETKLVASSSRLIALIGMLVIVFLFIGFGTFLLCDFGRNGTLPDISGILRYLVGGMTLFAPYVVNKFSSIFASK